MDAMCDLIVAPSACTINRLYSCCYPELRECKKRRMQPYNTVARASSA